MDHPLGNPTFGGGFGNGGASGHGGDPSQYFGGNMGSGDQQQYLNQSSSQIQANSFSQP